MSDLATEIERRLSALSLDGLMTQAERLTQDGFGAIVTYSRKVFIPLTRLCRDVCHHCTFATTPAREALHNGWDKKDSKDAQVILHMLQIGATQRYFDPLAAGINDLQEMSKTHEAISKAKLPSLIAY